jgi:hypothetical protein
LVPMAAINLSTTYYSFALYSCRYIWRIC